MEVLVIFEGGDPDKPIVIGCLHNATHPTAFRLPSDKSRSGWRTHSTPHADGSNELSFEDAVGQEQIFIHAQRDLDEVVERDHTLLVRKDETTRILGNATANVEGDRIDVVSGNRDDRVSGALSTRVEQKERRSVLGTADFECADDWTTRVRGSMTTIVGQHDAKRSWLTHAQGTATLSSLDATEVSSEKELVLRVGRSSIRIKDDQIEINSPSVTVNGAGAGISASRDGLRLASQGDAQMVVANKLVLCTQGASLAMQKQVKIDGSQILLNSPDHATDPPPKPLDPPTTIEVVDQNGRPLPHQRFVVHLDDGSEVSGFSNEEGKAVLWLAQGGTVRFPEAKPRTSA